MYITTSRKPSNITRKFARLIANFIGTYENRGKKSIGEIVARADKLGHSRMMLISESHGRPVSLSFIEIGKEWRWLEPDVVFSIKRPLSNMRKIGKQVRYDGEKKYAYLFDLPEPNTDDVIIVRMNDKQISLSYRKSIIKLEIKGLRKLEIER